MNHSEPLNQQELWKHPVVICFQISIFEPLGTASTKSSTSIRGCDLLSN